MTPNSGKMKSRVGFTLVELLMTIAIIATLSAIALPEYHRYRSRVFNVTAESDLAQFRNAVINMETPVSFFVSQAGPATHPNLPDVKISPNVCVWSFTWDSGAGWIFLGWSCHISGDTGYFMYIPFTGSDPWGGWIVPNQINENPGYRWLCPC